MRLTYGPGYRVYHLQYGDNLVLLLYGGDKSTPQADIDRAHHGTSHRAPLNEKSRTTEPKVSAKSLSPYFWRVKEETMAFTQRIVGVLLALALTPVATACTASLPPTPTPTVSVTPTPSASATTLSPAEETSRTRSRPW